MTNFDNLIPTFDGKITITDIFSSDGYSGPADGYEAWKAEIDKEAEIARQKRKREEAERVKFVKRFPYRCPQWECRADLDKDYDICPACGYDSRKPVDRIGEILEEDGIYDDFGVVGEGNWEIYFISEIVDFKGECRDRYPGDQTELMSWYPITHPIKFILRDKTEEWGDIEVSVPLPRRYND